MDYLELVKGGLMENWGAIAVVVLPFLAPNKLVESVSYTAGKFITTILRQKTGKSGESVEKYFQGTLDAALRGLNAGLDSDD